MSNKRNRAGAVRKKGSGKAVGSGGQGRQALEGRGPTPKAEDRPYHPKGKAKLARERYQASQAKNKRSGERPGDRSGGRPKKAASEHEYVTGRNSVLEALRTKVPVAGITIASGTSMDDRMREIIAIAVSRGIPVLETVRQELDRMTSADTVHQGIIAKVPPYKYLHPDDLFEQSRRGGRVPLLVVLDGITDPRNLGAIIRSVAAFGGTGVVVPQRRSVGVNAAAWKTSAGAAARVPVAMATNLTQALKSFKLAGAFVVGLDGDGEVELHNLQFANDPLVVVVGSEGKGISRLVKEQCDAVVSIPISRATESLNAGIATSVALYEISQKRAAK